MSHIESIPIQHFISLCYALNIKLWNKDKLSLYLKGKINHFISYQNTALNKKQEGQCGPRALTWVKLIFLFTIYYFFSLIKPFSKFGSCICNIRQYAPPLGKVNICPRGIILTNNTKKYPQNFISANFGQTWLIVEKQMPFIYFASKDILINLLRPYTGPILALRQKFEQTW